MAIKHHSNETFLDSNKLMFGTGEDLQMLHDGSNSYIHHNGTGSLYMKADTGNIQIINYTNDADIVLQSDNGSGGVTPYLTIDGGLGYTTVQKRMQLQDSVGLYLGTSTGDLIYHNGSNTFWTHQVGDLTIETNQDNGDIIFKSDDGSGGTAEYFRVDGGDESVVFSKTPYIPQYILHVGDGDTYFGFATDDTFRVGVGGTQRLNIATGIELTGNTTLNGNLTVTSGTSGDATLIISADTDNSEEGDSPRLWFKADGDITEGAIQHNDNTFDFISNVSSSGGFRFLTGTTNNTGTTDPSTGATERMSIANTGTVTVAGALQPNTIELGHASDTTIARSAAGKVTIEGAPIQTTQIVTSHHNMSLDGGSSTVDYYFPINSLADGSSSSLYYTRVLPAYDGKIVKMLFRASNVMGSSCTIYMSRRAHDGTSTSHQTSSFQASETFDGSVKSTVVVPCGVGGSNAADWVFEEGDQLGFSLVKNTTATNVDLTVTIVYEYTIS